MTPMGTAEAVQYIINNPGALYDFKCTICGVDSHVKIKYNSVGKEFYMMHRYNTPTGNYTFSGWGNFTNDNKTFSINYLKNKYTDTSTGNKIVVETYYDIRNGVKNILVEEFNGASMISTSYFMTDIKDGVSSTCDMRSAFPTHSTMYVKADLNSYFTINKIVFDNVAFNQNYTTQYVENITYATDCVGTDKCLDGKQDAEYYLYPIYRTYNNWDNVRFIVWEDPGTPFSDLGKYFDNSKKDIRTRLIKDLGFKVRTDQDMENDKSAKNFGLFSISVEGHVTMGLVDLRVNPGSASPDEIIYLADYSTAHYYEEETDPITGKTVIKTIFSSLKPTELELDEDGLEQIKQQPDEYVKLLSNNNLQECSTCFIWFSESVIYANSKFRHGNQVVKAYNIGQAQVEIGSVLSEKIDGRLRLNLGLTLEEPKNIKDYNRFFYFSFKPDSDEFEASKLPIITKPVYVLKKAGASRILLTDGYEEMLLQKQKKLIPLSFLKDSLIKDEEYMKLITPGFFGIKNKMDIQDKIENGKIYIELFAIIENENNIKNRTVNKPRKLLIENASSNKIPDGARWENYWGLAESGEYSVYTNKNHPSEKVHILGKKYHSDDDLDTDRFMDVISGYGWEAGELWDENKYCWQ
ncbi:hypothetical protein FACS1894152_2260 [Bacilli bacterium]|nr:hypothetical protein FACS1894152_2260 [Bacilli bacterium]